MQCLIARVHKLKCVFVVLGRRGSSDIYQLKFHYVRLVRPTIIVSRRTRKTNRPRTVPPRNRVTRIIGKFGGRENSTITKQVNTTYCIIFYVKQWTSGETIIARRYNMLSSRPFDFEPTTGLKRTQNV